MVLGVKEGRGIGWTGNWGVEVRDVMRKSGTEVREVCVWREKSKMKEEFEVNLISTVPKNSKFISYESLYSTSANSSDSTLGNSTWNKTRRIGPHL
ncbi:hypothetical protein HZH66_007403 [Vespula vulgaris]|uniref:Uncharacterized protein n=1 Tax=Vespula vulgaris TaxID=7454 RepID=A0A834K3E6_VESVU|nr:hypothetical protein HZH66_007403 [Vespula vulgaris]